ncbi:MAG: ABC transporter permease [Clostridiaceae bacterium]
MHKNKFIVSILAIILGFAIGAVVMIASGHNPVEAYSALLKGAGFFGDLKRFGDTLLNMTTLILAGLSVAFAFRTGLFNIGVAGQMLVGGFVAVLIGVKLSLPSFLHVTIAVVCAGVAGALWAFLPGLLKSRYKIHEVVSTIMFNYIAMWSVYYFVPVYILGNNNTESSAIKPSASLRVEWLSDLFNGSYVNMGLFISIIAVCIVWWILDKTTFGYELKSVGFNINASKYAGMKVNQNIILSMMISGLLAGLAGATFYIGYADNIKIGVLPSQGYDAIAIALLGLNNPVGVVLASFLFGLMNAGSLFMSSSANVPNELIPIIVAIIIYFAATSLMLETWLQKITKTFKRNEGDK